MSEWKAGGVDMLIFLVGLERPSCGNFVGDNWSSVQGLFI